jgi:hypothetical protein
MFIKNSEAVEKSGNFEVIRPAAFLGAGKHAEEDFLSAPVLSAEPKPFGEIGRINTWFSTVNSAATVSCPFPTGRPNSHPSGSELKS